MQIRAGDLFLTKQYGPVLALSVEADYHPRFVVLTAPGGHVFEVSYWQAEQWIRVPASEVADGDQGR